MLPALALHAAARMLLQRMHAHTGSARAWGAWGPRSTTHLSLPSLPSLLPAYSPGPLLLGRAGASASLERESLSLECCDIADHAAARRAGPATACYGWWRRRWRRWRWGEGLLHGRRPAAAPWLWLPLSKAGWLAARVVGRGCLQQQS